MASDLLADSLLDGAISCFHDITRSGWLLKRTTSNVWSFLPWVKVGFENSELFLFGANAQTATNDDVA